MKKILKIFNNKYVLIVCSLIMFILLIGSINLAVTGAWYGGGTTVASEEASFGSIEINSVVNTIELTDSQSIALSDIMPGDEINVSFSLENTGTADMYVKFKFEIIDNVVLLDGESKVTITYPDAPTGYTLIDFDGNATDDVYDWWYVRNIELIGNLNVSTNDEAEEIDAIILIGQDMGNSYKDESLSFNLEVNFIQSANNGTDVFDCSWAE